MALNLMDGQKGVSHKDLAAYLGVDAKFLANAKGVPVFQVWTAPQIKAKFSRKADAIIDNFQLN